MTRLLTSAAASLALLLWVGCDREERRFHAPPHMNQLATGSAQNPQLSPGAAAKAPAGQLQVTQPVNPYEENAYMVSQGKQLYTFMNCVGCHANGGGGMGPPLMDDEWLYGIEPVNIYQSIIEGRPNGMPSYRGKLTNVQVWQLVAYVRSMSGQLRKDVSPSRVDHMHVKVQEQEKEKETPTKQQPGAEEKERPQ